METPTAPRFCPNCSAAFRDTFKTKAVVPVGDGDWDCYCATCEWSGDISPDSKIN